MTEIFYDKDADLSLIQGKKVAVIGYGSQGHAHALNLRDSGVEVKIGLKPDSKSVQKATEAGFEVLSSAEAAKWADVVVILAPDQHQRGLYAADIRDNLEAGNAILFGHGFNIRFGYIEAPEGIDVDASSPPRGPATPCVASSRPAAASPIIVAVEKDASGTCLGPRLVVLEGRSAACAPAASRPPSPKRPRPTCSASRPCSAAAPRS